MSESRWLCGLAVLAIDGMEWSCLEILVVERNSASNDDKRQMGSELSD